MIGSRDFYWILSWDFSRDPIFEDYAISPIYLIYEECFYVFETGELDDYSFLGYINSPFYFAD